ncbi:MAG TPA: flagellar hook-length control protein FliK [Fimbriimonadales bacterium]|nr:flagellar hook-length control protein FliK [Fimbriimonadales bacterium]
MHIELSAILPSLPQRRPTGQEAPQKATYLLGKVRENVKRDDNDQGQQNTVEKAPASSPNRLVTSKITRRASIGKQSDPGAAGIEQNAEQRLPDRGYQEKPSIPLLGVPFFGGIELPFYLSNTPVSAAIPHTAIRDSAEQREVNSSPANPGDPHRPVGMKSEDGESPRVAIPLIPSRLLIRMSGNPSTPEGGRNLPSSPNQNEVPEIAKDLINRLRSHIEGETPETSHVPENVLRSRSERGGTEETIVEWVSRLIREGVPHRTVLRALRSLFEAEQQSETRAPLSIAPENALDLHNMWERIRGRHTHAENIERVEHRENEPIKAFISEPSIIDFDVEQESVERPATPRSENGIRNSMPGEISPHAVSPSTPDNRPMQRIETRPLLNTVIERLQEMLESKREKTITIQLDPPELGKLSVTVRTQGHRVETEILVSHPDVRTVLEANREQLVHALNSRGLHLGGMHIGAQANPHRDSMPFSVAPVPPVWRHEGISTAENLRPNSLVWFRTSGLDFSV